MLSSPLMQTIAITGVWEVDSIARPWRAWFTPVKSASAWSIPHSVYIWLVEQNVKLLHSCTHVLLALLWSNARSNAQALDRLANIVLTTVLWWIVYEWRLHVNVPNQSVIYHNIAFCIWMYVVHKRQLTRINLCTMRSMISIEAHHRHSHLGTAFTTGALLG